MAHFRGKKYYSYWEISNLSDAEKILYRGADILMQHSLFYNLGGDIYVKAKFQDHKMAAAVVDKKGDIYVNPSAKLTPQQWAYSMAHCLLHHAFGHFDKENMPSEENGPLDIALWNKACDIYIAQFLADAKFGEPICEDPAQRYNIKLNDEKKIYEHLRYINDSGKKQEYGTCSESHMDMIGLENPIVYKKGEENRFTKQFLATMADTVRDAVLDAGEHNWREYQETPVTRAAEWFLTHYPLLGGVAASFKIIQDTEFCQKNEIHIAAVDASCGEIYVNRTAKLSEMEWRFVLAHEYLHAGLQHQKRCQGRDPYLWNIACDYVINSWLHEMRIGKMPDEGLLYDETLTGLSAESIYDIIVKEIRKYRKLDTFRGFGKGDIFAGSGYRKADGTSGVSLDEFFRNALKEGLDFHDSSTRGYLPAGLVAEIQAMATPPIPWEVELGKWFDHQFPPLEKVRSYARASRRQGATPDIPRPNYVNREKDLENRTFAVVLDTSGSMSEHNIAKALGAISSYAISKEVSFVRVVFCDAEAYDSGYMSPEDIAGRVKITGGGGTVLQPAIDLIEKSDDFPATGPILIITDGLIESDLKVHREHAYLLQKGHKLPFKTKKGSVFYL